jgi:hypothetical protein
MYLAPRKERPQSKEEGTTFVVKKGIELFGNDEATTSLLADAEVLLSCTVRDRGRSNELQTKLTAEGVELVEQPDPGEYII